MARSIVRNFAVRGEAALDRVVAGAPAQKARGVEFSSLEVNFVRAPGALEISNGVVRGPVIGATLDGTIDYRADTVRASGVLVPLYALNNLFGQLPIVGFFLGGGFNSQNEGLLGINYQVVGSPGAPELLVNPGLGGGPGHHPQIHSEPVQRADQSQRAGSRPELIRPPTVTRDNRSAAHSVGSHRLQQHVALAPERELDDAFGRQIAAVSCSLLVGHTAASLTRKPPPLI